jgi:hypothetical protein
MVVQSTWSRAWKDTEHFRESVIFFWTLEVVGAAMFGVVGGIVGYWLTPQSASAFRQNVYSGIGAGMGIIIGFVIVFVSIFAWNLFRAPYRQRDEVSRLYEPIAELATIKPGDVINGKDINVPLMFQQLKSDSLSNVKFEHCVLRGPCTIGFMGNPIFDSCNFTGRGKLSDRLIKAEPTRLYGGIGLFVHCKFEFCEFANLSLLLPEDIIKKFLKKVVEF